VHVVVIVAVYCRGEEGQVAKALRNGVGINIPSPWSGEHCELPQQGSGRSPAEK